MIDEEANRVSDAERVRQLSAKAHKLSDQLIVHRLIILGLLLLFALSGFEGEEYRINSAPSYRSEEGGRIYFVKYSWWGLSEQIWELQYRYDDEIQSKEWKIRSPKGETWLPFFMDNIYYD